VRSHLDRFARDEMRRRLGKAAGGYDRYASWYVDDVGDLLSALELAEQTRDAAQAGGTSVVRLRQKVVEMLRAFADQIAGLRIGDES